MLEAVQTNHTIETGSHEVRVRQQNRIAIMTIKTIIMKPPKGLNDLSDTLAIGFHSNDHHGGEILTLSSEDRYNGVKKNASIYKSSLKKRVWRKQMRNTVWTKYIGLFVALFLLFAFSSVTIVETGQSGNT